MRVAAIYDIHGNLPALQAVLNEIEAIGVDQIVVGGDLIPGPFPNETVSLIQSLKTETQVIRGNCERELLTLIDGKESTVPPNIQQNLIWCGKQLGDSQTQFLRQLPSDCRLNIDGLGEVLFCHATPTSDSQIFTKNSPVQKLEQIFKDVDSQVVVCGHTHMQFSISVANKRILNAGSVGMPFGNPGAYWLMFDSEIKFYCTDFNLEESCELVRQTDYPEAIEFADKHIKNPATEAEMLALFESVSQKQN